MIFSNQYSFAALKEDGSVVCWGNNQYGGTSPNTKEIVDLDSFKWCSLI